MNREWATVDLPTFLQSAVIVIVGSPLPIRPLAMVDDVSNNATLVTASPSTPSAGEAKNGAREVQLWLLVTANAFGEVLYKKRVQQGQEYIVCNTLS
jgi:hypothetical protein